MIDLDLLRDDPARVIAQLKKKDPEYDVQRLLDLDAQIRGVRHDVETLRQQKNELAREGRAGVTPELRERSIELGKHIKDKETDLQELEQTFNEHALSCPNIPFDDLPVGGKKQNVVVKEEGKKPSFTFPVKNHVEIGTNIGWLDFESATIIASGNFALYKGEAVKLLYALTMFMLKNNIKHGYEPVLPSFLVNERSLEVSSNFPKFRDQVYEIPKDKLYLTPTAEVNLANLYREHILATEDLPVRMTAWTSCFRREAGTYGATERGLIRIHQFEKVELYTICEPERSSDELDRMVACAENILQQLDLHYRISLLATQDCSFASAKTYDLEVWLPGQKEYYEVSSCSNCTDFQARRGLIRYRKHTENKPQLVHTLNGSSLALPRLMVAIMETYQQADGSVIIPEVLKKEGIFSDARIPGSLLPK
ncbi:MAG: serine--tRNA ligase [bacterium]|nr:serine--tRNA ligase [bacterium]